MAHRSTVVITKEGKWYVARSLEVGVTSQGRSVEESTKNLQEAIELYFEDAPKSKRNLPDMLPMVTSIEVK
ncbi:MAG: type II toxin-antitoxin system HicB family antitoxin [Candidatus Liptonbacteria bacterium]|nr:type II toxin-antitoxin system HicB family antitoxin [Candidatus Liptonbacteria bacterium]